MIIDIYGWYTLNVPIVIKLDDMLHDRRLTLTELADRVGLTLANLSILKTGKARAIRFSTLGAICEALSCQPGDILRFQPELASRERRPVAKERRPAEETTRPDDSWAVWRRDG